MVRPSSEEREAVARAAASLPPERRQAFVDQVTTTLQNVPMIGPGILHRAIVAAQRTHFDPPRYVTNSAPRSRRVVR